jgi:hypothetical protein
MQTAVSGNRRPRYRSMLVLLAFGVIVAVLAAWCARLQSNQQKWMLESLSLSEFDPAVWKSARDKSNQFPSTRQTMLRSLFRSLSHLTSKNELESLLGKSKERIEMRKISGGGYYYEDYEWDIIYNIGCGNQTRLGQVDPADQWLVFRFDKSELLESWYIVNGELANQCLAKHVDLPCMRRRSAHETAAND